MRAADSDSEDEDAERARRRDRSPSSSPLPDVDGRRARSPSSSPLPGDDNDDSEASDDEGAAFAAAMRAELRGGRTEGASREKDSKDSRSKDKVDKRAGTKSPGSKERSFGGEPSHDLGAKSSKPDLRKGSKFLKDRAEAKAKTKARPVARALSPEKTAKPTIDPAAFRAKKKEAFGKHHHVGTKRGQPNMGARMDLLLEKIRMAK